MDISNKIPACFHFSAVLDPAAGPFYRSLIKNDRPLMFFVISSK